MGYLCDNQDGQEGAFLVTSLADGETLVFCNEHFPSYIAAMYNGIFMALDDAVTSLAADPVTGDETDDDAASDGEPAEPAEPAAPEPEPVDPPADAARAGRRPRAGKSGVAVAP